MADTDGREPKTARLHRERAQQRMNDANRRRKRVLEILTNHTTTFEFAHLLDEAYQSGYAAALEDAFDPVPLDE